MLNFELKTTDLLKTNNKIEENSNDIFILKTKLENPKKTLKFDEEKFNYEAKKFLIEIIKQLRVVKVEKEKLNQFDTFDLEAFQNEVYGPVLGMKKNKLDIKNFKSKSKEEKKDEVLEIFYFIVGKLAESKKNMKRINTIGSFISDIIITQTIENVYGKKIIINKKNWSEILENFLNLNDGEMFYGIQINFSDIKDELNKRIQKLTIQIIKQNLTWYNQKNIEQIERENEKLVYGFNEDYHNTFYYDFEQSYNSNIVE